MKICQAITRQEIALSRALFEEYAAWFGIDLSFQGFAAELASLPGLYAPPRGLLFLAQLDNGQSRVAQSEQHIMGCVALRPLEGAVCEMKRLFVRPAFRGQGLGRLLAERAIKEAQGIGYSTMRLDTLPSMPAAIGLYEALGFVRCPAYYETPLRETVFMELKW